MEFIKSRSLRRSLFYSSLGLCAVLGFQNCVGSFNTAGTASNSSLSVNGAEAVTLDSEASNCSVVHDNAEVTPIRPLSTIEYTNTIGSVFNSGTRLFYSFTTSSGNFGNDIKAALKNVPQDVSQDSIETYIRFTSTSTSMTPDRLQAYHQIALTISGDVAQLSASNLSSYILRLLDSCGNGTLPLSDACYTTMVQKMGLIFYRRPLTSSQISAAKTAMGSGTLQSQISELTYYFLMSPDFLFHLEADGTVTDNVLTLDSYAIASRLSYLLMGTMPDTELFSRAAANQLTTSAGVASAVDYIRTTYDAAVRTRFWQFVSEWLKVPTSAIEGSPKVAALASPNFTSSSYAAVRSNMNLELRTMFEHYVFDAPDTYKNLFTSQLSFAKDAIVPTLYDTGVWDGVSAPPVQPPNERAGFLTTAALITTGGETTNPFAMGGLVFKHILCRQFGDIEPPDTQPALDPADDDQLMTTRERFEKLVPRGSSCMACHSYVESLGMPFQDYDAFGRNRHGFEKIFDDSGNLVGSKLIDTNQTPMINGQTVAVHNGIDLVHQLAATDEPGICFAKQFFRFAESRMDDNRDSCVISRFANNIAAGDMWSAIKAFVSDDWFLKRRLQ